MRAVVVMVAALAALVLGAPAAQAHALLVRSDPASGAVLAEPPTLVTLWFDEEISPELSTARLVDGQGRTVDGTQVGHDDGDGRVLTLSVPGLGVGSFGVLWRVLAEDDGHTSSGTVVFSVGPVADGSAPAPAVAASTTPTPAAVALRWLRIAALAGLVGALAVLGVVAGRFRRSEPPLALAVTVETARRRLLALALVAAAAGVLVALADLVEQVGRLRVPGTPWWATAASLLGARWGHLWVARVVLLLVALVAVLALRGRAQPGGRRRVMAGLAVGAAAGLAWVEAAGSHAAAVEGARAVTMAADAVHVLGACLWLGSVGALVVVLWPHAVGASGLALARACRGWFSRVVLVSVGAVLATGLYGAGRQVTSVGDLVSTAYGRALVVKLGLVAGTLTLGLVNSTRLHGLRLRLPPGGPARPFSRRLVALEVAVGALLLGGVAVLVESAPNRDAADVPSAPQATIVSGALDDLVVSVAASPSRPGLNGLTVTVASSRRPAPAPVDAVRVALDGSEVVLQESGPDRWFGTASVDRAGNVSLDVVVERGGTTARVPLTWPVADAAPAAPAQAPDGVRGARLAPVVDVLALLVVAVGAVAGVAAVVVGRRRRAAVAAKPVTGPEEEPVESGHPR